MEDKTVLLADVLRIKNKIDHVPSIPEYKQHGGIYSQRQFRKLFGNWGNALTELGFGVRKNWKPDSVFYKNTINYETFDQFPRIHAEKIIIAFDPHVPYHDIEACNELIKTARNRKITKLIIGGDLIDFKGLYKKEAQGMESDWTEEISECVRFLKVLTKQFEEIWILMGNHDWRLVRLLESNKRAQNLYQMIFCSPKIHFTKYFYVLLNEWLYIIHPDRSRKGKLSLVEELCDHHRKSVIMGHSHRFAFGVHDSGEDIIGEGLCLTNPLLHEYHGVKLDVHSQWVKGFWIMEGNRVSPYIQHPLVLNLEKG